MLLDHGEPRNHKQLDYRRKNHTKMIFGFLVQNPYNYFCYMVLQKPYNYFWLYGYIVLNPYSFKNHITV